MMEVCEDSRFFFGQADLLLAYLDTLHQKGHVAAKGAHGLQALGIFLDLLGRAAVDHVPILAAGHWHPTHGKIFVQHIVGSSVAAAPTGHDRSTHFHGLVDVQGTEEQAVHKGDRAACRGTKVHRCANDKGIGFSQLGGYFVDNIIKDALVGAGAVAAAAGDAAPDVLVAHMDDLGFNALGFQRICQFGQGRKGAAVGPRTAVDEQCFHTNILLLILSFAFELLQLCAIGKRIADPLAQRIVAVMDGVIGDGDKFGEVKFAILAQNAFVHADVLDLAEVQASFDDIQQLTLQRQRQFIDDGRIPLFKVRSGTFAKETILETLAAPSPGASA